MKCSYCYNVLCGKKIYCFFCGNKLELKIDVHLKKGFNDDFKDILDVGPTPMNFDQKIQDEIKVKSFAELTYDYWGEIFKKSHKQFPKFVDLTNTQYMLFDHNFDPFKTLITDMIKIYDDFIGSKVEFQGKPIKIEENNIFGLKLEIPNDSDVYFIGDIHSSFHSLYYIFYEKLHNIFDPNNNPSGFKLKQDKYIFLTGDLLDYGPYGLEIIFFMMTLKFYNPENVFIINGNHEQENTYERYQFKDELEEQIKNSELKENIKKLLQYLPTVIFLKINGKTIQINHGAIIDEGYNNHTHEFKDSRLKIFLEGDSNIISFLTEEEINSDKIDGRDFLWGDFKFNPDNYDEKGYIKDFRSKFSYDMVKKYLDHHNIEFIISGHQDTVSFSIMPNLDYLLNPDHIKHSTGVNYLKQFIIDKFDDSQKLNFDDEYQFLITHNFGNYNDLNKDEYNFKLTRDDFIALVLSTVVTNVKFNSYHSYINLKLE